MSLFGSSFSQGSVFTFLLFVFNFILQAVTQSSRIPYGSEAKVQDFPYITTLEKCGTGILSERWVATAAHCVRNPNLIEGNYVWIHGENNSVPLKFDKIITHPEYQIFKPINIPINDIALLRLEEPIQLSAAVRPLKLPEKSAPIELTHVFIDEERDEHGETFKVLKKVDLIRLTSQQCISGLPFLQRQYIQRYLPTLARAIICTKRADNQSGVCMGDSGSPLVKKDVIYGLGSHVGSGNCHEIRLILFTNLFTYLPWIRSITNLK